MKRQKKRMFNFGKCILVLSFKLHTKFIFLFYFIELNQKNIYNNCFSHKYYSDVLELENPKSNFSAFS